MAATTVSGYTSGLEDSMSNLQAKTSETPSRKLSSTSNMITIPRTAVASSVEKVSSNECDELSLESTPKSGTTQAFKAEGKCSQKKERRVSRKEMCSHSVKSEQSESMEENSQDCKVGKVNSVC